MNQQFMSIPTQNAQFSATDVAQRENNIKELSKLSKEEWREYTKSVWSIANTSHPTHPAVFPVEIPRRLIKLFSFYGETVLDPFCGVGNTGIAAKETGRAFIGQDISPEYITLAEQELNEIPAINATATYQLRTGDSRDLSFLPDNSVSLIVTSPPYWNKADYGNYNANIGALDIYGDFLCAMETVMRECYRVLQPGRRFCIVTANVHQHTKDGLLTFPIAGDLTSRAQSLGFLLVNEIIWSKDRTGGKWGSAGKQRPIFGSYPYPPNFLFKNIHEYIIILKKPTEEKKSNKAPEYQDLLGNNY